MKIKKRFSLCLFSLLFLLGCTGTRQPIPPLPLEEMATPVPIPKFIYGVWPEPGSSVVLSDYQKGVDDGLGPQTGIGVDFFNEYILCDESIYGVDNYFIDEQVDDTEKVYLLVNGVGISSSLRNDYVIATKFIDKDQDGNLLCEGPGGVAYSWAVPLEQGVYQAEVSVRIKSGKRLRYAWSFRIE
jgi:hypothetical protein